MATIFFEENEKGTPQRRPFSKLYTLNSTLFFRSFEQYIAQQIPEHLDCLNLDSLVR